MKVASAALAALALVPPASSVAVGRIWRPLRPLFGTGAAPAQAEAAADVPRVSQWMTPVERLVTLAPSMSLSEAACALRESSVSGAPVVEGKRLLGVLSQKDLLYNAAGRARVRLATSGPRSERVTTNEQRLRRIMDARVESLMSARLTTVTPDTSMQDAASLLIERKISRLPVVDRSGSLVGLLSTSDVMDVVANCVEDEETGCCVF